MKLGEPSAQRTFWASMADEQKMVSLDAKMNRSVGSSMAWPPKGPLLEKWKEVLPVILKLVNEPTNNDYIFYKSTHPRVYLCELLLVGDKPHGPRLKPTIVVFCRQKKYAKRMVNVLQKSRYMSRMSLGFEYLAHDTFQQDVYRVAADHEANGDDAITNHRDNLCGAGITVVSSGQDGVPQSRIATLGGVIEVNDQLYGMTTAHALLGSPTSSGSANSSTTDESDDEEDNSDDDATSFEPRDPIDGSDSQPASEQPAVSDYRVYIRQPIASRPSSDESGPPSQPGKLFATHPDEINRTKPMISSSTNFALLPITDSQITNINQVQSADKTITPSKISKEVPDGPVTVASGSSGVWTTTTSGVPRGIVLPPSRTMLPCITLEGTSVEGDSGSWVMDPDTGDVYAMIVATSASANETYCVPMSAVLAGLGEFTGSEVRINLPDTPGNSSLATGSKKEEAVDGPGCATERPLPVEENVPDAGDTSSEHERPPQQQNTLVNQSLADQTSRSQSRSDEGTVETTSAIPEADLEILSAATTSVQTKKSVTDKLSSRSEEALSMNDMLFQRSNLSETKDSPSAQAQRSKLSPPASRGDEIAGSSPSIQQQSLKTPRRPRTRPRQSQSDTHLTGSLGTRKSRAVLDTENAVDDRPTVPRQTRQSNRMRVHRDILFPETLDAWNLPWKFDPQDKNYILIEQVLNEQLLEELYKYTDMLRQQSEADIGESRAHEDGEEQSWSREEVSETEGAPTVILAATGRPKAGVRLVGDGLMGREQDTVRDNHRRRSYSSERVHRRENDPNSEHAYGRRAPTAPRRHEYRRRRWSRTRDRSSSSNTRPSTGRRYVLPESSIASGSPVLNRSMTWFVEEHHDQAFLTTMREVFYSNSLPREICEHLVAQFRQVQAAKREAVAALSSSGLPSNVPIQMMNRPVNQPERRGTPTAQKYFTQPGRSRAGSLNYSVSDASTQIRGQLKSPEGPRPRIGMIQQPVPIREHQGVAGPGVLRYGAPALELIAASPAPPSGLFRTASQPVVAPDGLETPLARSSSMSQVTPASTPNTPKPRHARDESRWDPATQTLTRLIRGAREIISPAAFRNYSDLSWEYSVQNPNDIIVKPWISDRMVENLMDYTQQYKDAQIRARIRGEIPSDDDDEGDDVGAVKRHKSMMRRKSKWAPAVKPGQENRQIGEMMADAEMDGRRTNLRPRPLSHFGP